MRRAEKNSFLCAFSLCSGKTFLKKNFISTYLPAGSITIPTTKMSAIAQISVENLRFSVENTGDYDRKTHWQPWKTP
jgi:hypothetical protein